MLLVSTACQTDDFLMVAYMQALVRHDPSILAAITPEKEIVEANEIVPGEDCENECLVTPHMMYYMGWRRTRHPPNIRECEYGCGAKGIGRFIRRHRRKCPLRPADAIDEPDTDDDDAPPPKTTNKSNSKNVSVSLPISNTSTKPSNVNKVNPNNSSSVNKQQPRGTAQHKTSNSQNDSINLNFHYSDLSSDQNSSRPISTHSISSLPIQMLHPSLSINSNSLSGQVASVGQSVAPPLTRTKTTYASVNGAFAPQILPTRDLHKTSSHVQTSDASPLLDYSQAPPGLMPTLSLQATHTQPNCHPNACTPHQHQQQIRLNSHRHHSVGGNPFIRLVSSEMEGRGLLEPTLTRDPWSPTSPFGQPSTSFSNNNNNINNNNSNIHIIGDFERLNSCDTALNYSHSNASASKNIENDLHQTQSTTPFERSYSLSSAPPPVPLLPTMSHNNTVDNLPILSHANPQQHQVQKLITAVSSSSSPPLPANPAEQQALFLSLFANTKAYLDYLQQVTANFNTSILPSAVAPSPNLQSSLNNNVEDEENTDTNIHMNNDFAGGMSMLTTPGVLMPTKTHNVSSSETSSSHSYQMLNSNDCGGGGE